MRVWRLLVETETGLWTYVVAAKDHLRAWQLVVRTLPRAERERATLEELEATGERRATGCSRVVHAWRHPRGPRADVFRGSSAEGLPLVA